MSVTAIFSGNYSGFLPSARTTSIRLLLPRPSPPNFIPCLTKPLHVLTRVSEGSYRSVHCLLPIRCRNTRRTHTGGGAGGSRRLLSSACSRHTYGVALL